MKCLVLDLKKNVWFCLAHGKNLVLQCGCIGEGRASVAEQEKFFEVVHRARGKVLFGMRILIPGF